MGKFQFIDRAVRVSQQVKLVVISLEEQLILEILPALSAIHNQHIIHRGLGGNQGG